MLCYAMRRTVSIFSAFKFSCKCVENMERKGEKIMAFFNDVATSSQSYNALYGKDSVRAIPLGKPNEIEGKKGKAIVKRFSLQRVDGQKPCGSKKVVTLPENSPLRRLGLDKFELTKEKLCKFGTGEVAPGLKKTLRVFGQDGKELFVGADSIRQFMKTIAHVIRKG